MNRLISILMLCTQLVGVTLGASGRGAFLRGVFNENLVAVSPRVTIESMKLKHGWTPLHFAAHFNHAEDAKILVTTSASLDAKDNYGDTPLHQAIHFKSDDVAKILIRAGASLEIKDRHGNTPLDLAIRGADVAMVDFLLSVDAKNLDPALDYLLRQNTGKRLEHRKSLVKEGSRTIGDPEYLMRERACARLLIAYGATTNKPKYQNLFNEICAELEKIKLCTPSVGK